MFNVYRWKIDIEKAKYIISNSKMIWVFPITIQCQYIKTTECQRILYFLNMYLPFSFDR